VLDAMLRWSTRYGRLPSSYDWSLTHARRGGGEPLERLNKGDRPSASVVNSGVRPAELLPNIKREMTRL
jgi:hypothetical protein